MKALAFLLLLSTAAFAQTGQCPPGGCVGGTTPLPPVCTAKSCLPPDIYGRVGECKTIVIDCPVLPPPAPTCVNSWGQIVPCK